jgi:hypothetical protein
MDYVRTLMIESSLEKFLQTYPDVYFTNILGVFQSSQVDNQD